MEIAEEIYDDIIYIVIAIAQTILMTSMACNSMDAGGEANSRSDPDNNCRYDSDELVENDHDDGVEQDIDPVRIPAARRKNWVGVIDVNDREADVDSGRLI